MAAPLMKCISILLAEAAAPLRMGTQLGGIALQSAGPCTVWPTTGSPELA